MPYRSESSHEPSPEDQPVDASQELGQEIQNSKRTYGDRLRYWGFIGSVSFSAGVTIGGVIAPAVMYGSPAAGIESLREYIGSYWDCPAPDSEDVAAIRDMVSRRIVFTQNGIASPNAEEKGVDQYGLHFASYDTKNEFDKLNHDFWVKDSVLDEADFLRRAESIDKKLGINLEIPQEDSAMLSYRHVNLSDPIQLRNTEKAILAQIKDYLEQPMELRQYLGVHTMRFVDILDPGVYGQYVPDYKGVSYIDFEAPGGTSIHEAGHNADSVTCGTFRTAESDSAYTRLQPADLYDENHYWDSTGGTLQSSTLSSGQLPSLSTRATQPTLDEYSRKSVTEDKATMTTAMVRQDWTSEIFNSDNPTLVNKLTVLFARMYDKNPLLAHYYLDPITAPALEQ